MVFVVLAVLLSVGFTYIGWRLWELKQMLGQFTQAQESYRQLPVHYNNLETRVKELHQTMGGVVNSLKVVGNQVQNLNILTENIEDSDMDDAAMSEFHRPRILIEFHPNDGSQSSQLVAPGDIPPELLQRFQVFQSVYMAILNQPEWPSSNSPESN